MSTLNRRKFASGAATGQDPPYASEVSDVSDLSDGKAKFSVGQVIHHRRFDYRGAIADVDATFQGSDEWYEEVARSRPPRDKPWYHVLVDGSDATTYVAERHLEPDSTGEAIRNPLLEHFFESYRDGRYVRPEPLN